jgi:hypothetical protein
MRFDNPIVDGNTVIGQWKIFFAGSMIREGIALPQELYDLSTDHQEQRNRLTDPSLRPLVKRLCDVALKHRRSGGHRLARLAVADQTHFDFSEPFDSRSGLVLKRNGLTLKVKSRGGEALTCGSLGLGIDGGNPAVVDDGEAVVLSADQDIIVEAIRLAAGPTGSCGGFFSLGDDAPLPVYCVDAHDEKYTKHDHSGELTDLGVLKSGETLVLDSAPHYGVNAPGSWRLQSITVRALE